MRKYSTRSILSRFPLTDSTEVLATAVKIPIRLVLVLVLALFSFLDFNPAMVAHAIIGKTIPVGNNPIGVAVDPMNDIVYVADNAELTNNGAANGADTVNFFSGNGQAPFGVNYIYYPAGRGPSEVAVDLVTDQLSFPPITFSNAYVTNNSNDSVSVIQNFSSSPSFTIPVGKQPAGIAANSMTNLVYVANFQDSTVSVIHGSNDQRQECSVCLTVVATIPVGRLPVGVAVNPTSNLIYVTNNLDNTVSVINGKDNTVGTPITVGNHPYGVAINSRTNRIYITNSNDGTVSVINGTTNSVVATIPVGTTPQAVAVNSSTNDIFVANAGDDTVSVIDGATNTVSGKAPVGHLPQGVAVNPITNRVYVTNSADNTVSEFLDPGAGRDEITIPVRWCAVQGSPATAMAGGQFFGPDGSSTTDQVLLTLLQQVNDQFWLPGAHIVFRAEPYPFMTGHFPIIPDPIRPGQGSPPGAGKLGDIGVHQTIFGDSSAEWDAAVLSCKAMWEQPAAAQGIPPVPGIIAINVREFVDDIDGTELTIAGVTPMAPASLQNSQHGLKADNLCKYPRHLTVDDVTPEESVAVVDPALYANNSQTIFEGQGDPALTLAHELGHALLLGHGNGLDPDQDGALPPNPGSRLFDSYCDPKGGPNSGDPNPPDNSCASLMDSENHSCPMITPLQREAARDVAVLVPGAFYHSVSAFAGELVQPIINRCLAILNCLASVGMSTDVETQTTTFSHTVFGQLPPDANNQYTVFVDSDNSPASGCAPSMLGFPTAFQGAELVTSVSVKVVDGVRQAVPTVWQCQTGRFVKVINPQISADAFTQTDADTGHIILFSKIVIQVPALVIGPTGNQIRIQAIAQQLGPGGRTDRLPNTVDGGGVISLAPPVFSFPECSLTSTIVHTGDVAMVTASGLTPNSKANVNLGDQLVATGHIDGSGNAHVKFVVPKVSRTGLRLITVATQGTVLSAACSIQIEKATPTPFPFNIFLFVLFALLAILILILVVSIGVYRHRRHAKT
jgi:YVTN family beta-propeller protein